MQKRISLIKILCLSTLCLIALPLNLAAESARIWADGEFPDWSQISTLHSDPAGDQLSGAIDFTVLKIANDEKYLFIYYQTGTEISLQNSSGIHLYLDTDNNSQTGYSINGIGADLHYDFGQKYGTFYFNGQSITVHHEDIGLVDCPTVTSDRFEIVLDKNALPNSVNPLFPQNNFRIVLKDSGPGSDMLPNQGQIVTASFQLTPLPPIQCVSLSKSDTSAVRIMSYNVEQDALFDPAKEAPFARIFASVEPEIIAFQEIYNHTSAQTAALIADFVPPPSGGQWYNAKTGPDIILLSIYPIISFFTIDGNGAFLLNMRPKLDSDLLIINVHFPAGSNDAGRQDEIDNVMSFIREAKLPGGALDLTPNTPFIIMGDMNLVGYAEQLNTLITGDIIQTSQYGPAFDPDWDNSDIADALPFHPNEPLSFTWYDEGSSFCPGRLDFFIYSDYIISPVKKFVLFTPLIPPDTLSAYGLLADDVVSVSDHVPIVIDIKPTASIPMQINDLRIRIENEDAVLTWTAPALSTGIYKIYRNSIPQVNIVPEYLLDEISSSSPGIIEYTDSDITSENDYFYVVTFEH